MKNQADPRPRTEPLWYTAVPRGGKGLPSVPANPEARFPAPNPTFLTVHLLSITAEHEGDRQEPARPNRQRAKNSLNPHEHWRESLSGGFGSGTGNRTRVSRLRIWRPHPQRPESAAEATAPISCCGTDEKLCPCPSPKSLTNLLTKTGYKGLFERIEPRESPREFKYLAFLQNGGIELQNLHSWVRIPPAPPAYS